MAALEDLQHIPETWERQLPMMRDEQEAQMDEAISRVQETVDHLSGMQNYGEDAVRKVQRTTQVFQCQLDMMILAGQAEILAEARRARASGDL